MSQARPAHASHHSPACVPDIEDEIADLAEAYGAEVDPDNPDVVPRLWTPAHVMLRMTEAFEVLRRSGVQAGPGQARGFWPAIIQQFEDLRELQAWRERQEQMARESGDDRKRPSLDECTNRDKALRWQWTYLSGHSLASDAFGLAAYSTACGFAPAKVLSSRLKRAKAMCALAQRDENKSMAMARKCADSEVARWYDERKAKAISETADPDDRADRLARLLSNAHIRRARAFDALKPAIIKPEDMMPGKVMRPKAYDRYRLLGATMIARGLNRDGVATW